MTISAIPSTVASLPNIAAGKSSAAASAAFGQIFAEATTGVSAEGSVAKASADVTSMTPKTMDGFAQRLYGEGKIDLTQLFELQNAGPLRTGDSASSSVRDAYRNTPVDYVAYAKDQMSGIAARGAAQDPKAGYQDWATILSVLEAQPRG